MSKDLFFELRSQEIAELVESAENGDVNALRIYAQLKRTNDLLSDAIKQIEPLALNEASKQGAKSFEAYGNKFELRNGSVRYSYKNIPIWDEKSKELKAIEEKSKLAYIAFSKGLLTADEYGEDIEFPEVTYTKDSLIVKK